MRRSQLLILRQAWEGTLRRKWVLIYFLVRVIWIFQNWDALLPLLFSVWCLLINKKPFSTFSCWTSQSYSPMYEPVGCHISESLSLLYFYPAGLRPLYQSEIDAHKLHWKINVLIEHLNISLLFSFLGCRKSNHTKTCFRWDQRSHPNPVCFFWQWPVAWVFLGNKMSSLK